MKDVYNFLWCFVINEDAYGIVALGQGCGFFRKSGIQEGYFTVVGSRSEILGQFLEEDTVIVLGSEESDLENMDGIFSSNFLVQDLLDVFQFFLFSCTIYYYGQNITFLGS